MEKFNQNKRKGFCIILLFVLMTFFAVAATAQRYRHGTYKVSYKNNKQERFVVQEIKDQDVLVQLKVTSNEEIMFFSYVIDMVVFFQDGSRVTIRNKPFQNGQDIFTTFFDINKKHRKIIREKEVDCRELHFKVREKIIQCEYTL